MRVGKEPVLRLSRAVTLVATVGGRFGAWEFPADTRLIRVRYYNWIDLTVGYVHTVEGWSKALYVGQLPLTREEMPCRTLTTSAIAVGSHSTATPVRADRQP